MDANSTYNRECCGCEMTPPASEEIGYKYDGITGTLFVGGVPKNIDYMIGGMIYEPA